MRHVTNVPLRWADMDAYGHVNNMVYLRYLQEARVDMLFVHAHRQGAEGLAGGTVVARHAIDYLAPLTYRQRPLRVETWVRDIRNSTFTLGYELVDVEDGGERQVYAVATTTLVPYDLGSGRPRRVAPTERAVLDGYRDLDGPVPSSDGDAARTDHRAASVAVDPGNAKPFSYPCMVRFDDLDSYGHVNNVRFIEYLQEARIDFAHRYLFDALEAHEGSVVAGLSVDYLAPVPFRTEPLDVRVWVTRIGGSSFDLGYDVRDADTVYARASTTLVAYDVRARRSRTLVPEERAALEGFMADGDGVE
ncbi:acyl-CoA thioesterase [Phytoactinopolyspora halotolerans]|uniref:Acyl-CoA thioesterase n=1 Tax=Phytoactinopolyspora halotolerans TaxID=1981512 RepID=A0A6L9SC56_9ACTN|nr:thioesterase family protein [Phytoactinopolyspora halotolerans]NEE02663.1 acyl-CoA thioesterase [Phytoactinopolyspora halotolerans]